MPLTDTALRQAKPGEKPIKLSDERGLFLLRSGPFEAGSTMSLVTKRDYVMSGLGAINGCVWPKPSAAFG